MRARLITLAVTILLCVASHSQGVPLPPAASLKPVETISSLPKSFHGRWEGLWGGNMPHVLVVEQVKSDVEAVAVYATQDPPGENFWSGGWNRVNASIDGNALRVTLRNGAKAWYEMQSDGSLKGSYQRSTGAQIFSASMKRQTE